MGLESKKDNDRCTSKCTFMDTWYLPIGGSACGTDTPSNKMMSDVHYVHPYILFDVQEA